MVVNMKDKVSFEQAMEQLDDIVESLENGDLSLEDSIGMFQKGIELSNLCSKKLDEAERKITMLIQTQNGELKETPFWVEEE